MERTALLSGDVRTLHDLGAHGYLLSRLARAGIADLTPETYVLRMKGNRRNESREGIHGSQVEPMLY